MCLTVYSGATPRRRRRRSKMQTLFDYILNHQKVSEIDLTIYMRNGDVVYDLVPMISFFVHSDAERLLSYELIGDPKEIDDALDIELNVAYLNIKEPEPQSSHEMNTSSPETIKELKRIIENARG